MSFYGAKELQNGVMIEKRRFGPANTLRYGNALFVAGYSTESLMSIDVAKDGDIFVVNSGAEGATVVSIGPKSELLTNIKVVDTVENLTVDANVRCVVLEGLVKVDDHVFDADIGLPYFTTSDQVELVVEKPSKLLLFNTVE